MIFRPFRRRLLSRLHSPWAADDPAPEYTRLDWFDGLRYAQCDETCTSDCGHCKGRRFGPYATSDMTVTLTADVSAFRDAMVRFGQIVSGTARHLRTLDDTLFASAAASRRDAIDAALVEFDRPRLTTATILDLYLTRVMAEDGAPR